MTAKKMHTNAQGFSLIELMVAITITLIISGAIFGLMGGGQSRFKQEPAFTERQQNIRLAMDMIGRDIGAAGMKMAPLNQVFQRGHNNVGPLGPGRTNGDLAGADNSDRLVFMGANSECPEIPGTVVGATFVPAPGFNAPTCIPPNGPVIVRGSINSGGAGLSPSWGFALDMQSGAPVNFNFSAPGAQVRGAGDLAGANQSLAALDVIRYEIAYVPGPWGTDGAPCLTTDTRVQCVDVPNLYRSTTGGMDAAGNQTAPPAAAGNWQLVASGIEDLQVVYQTANGTFADEPPVVAPLGGLPDNGYLNLVRSVRVTISARVVVSNPRSIEGTYTAEDEAGMNALSPGGGMVRRGLLTSTFTPRAALAALRWTGDNNPVPPQVRWQ